MWPRVGKLTRLHLKHEVIKRLGCCWEAEQPRFIPKARNVGVILAALRLLTVRVGVARGQGDRDPWDPCTSQEGAAGLQGGQQQGGACLITGAWLQDRVLEAAWCSSLQRATSGILQEMGSAVCDEGTLQQHDSRSTTGGHCRKV